MAQATRPARLAAFALAVLATSLAACPPAAPAGGPTETRVVLVGPGGRAAAPLQAGVEYDAFLFVLPEDEACLQPTGTVTVSVDGDQVGHLALANRFAGTTVTFLEPGTHRLTVAYSGDASCARSRHSELLEVA